MTPHLLRATALGLFAAGVVSWGTALAHWVPAGGVMVLALLAFLLTLDEPHGYAPESTPLRPDGTHDSRWR